jgi:hypothetical protein
MDININRKECSQGGEWGLKNRLENFRTPTSCLGIGKGLILYVK